MRCSPCLYASVTTATHQRSVPYPSPCITSNANCLFPQMSRTSNLSLTSISRIISRITSIALAGQVAPVPKVQPLLCSLQLTQRMRKIYSIYSEMQASLRRISSRSRRATRPRAVVAIDIHAVSVAVAVDAVVGAAGVAVKLSLLIFADYVAITSLCESNGMICVPLLSCVSCARHSPFV